jgi:hypothetical protein
MSPSDRPAEGAYCPPAHRCPFEATSDLNKPPITLKESEPVDISAVLEKMAKTVSSQKLEIFILYQPVE